MLDLRRVRSFVTVAEELHFGRAAARLHVAQPALSQQVQQLEAELGVRLLNRTTRSVQLTDAGKAFLDEALQTLRLAERAENVARRASRGEIGRLAVGYLDFAFYSIVPEIVRHFRAAAPDVDFTLRGMDTAEPIPALHSREIDVGFVRAPIHDDLLTHRTVLSEPLIAVIPDTHPCASDDRITLHRLLDDPLLLYPRSGKPEVHDAIVQMCRQARARPQIVDRYAPLSIVDLVAVNMGVSLVPACVRVLRRPGVAYLDLDGDSMEVETAVCWRTEDDSPTIHAFLRSVTAVTERTVSANPATPGSRMGQDDP